MRYVIVVVHIRKFFFFSARPDDWNSDSGPIWQLTEKYPGHALLLDTGAASNSSGANPVRRYELGCLVPRGYTMPTEFASAAFSGIGAEREVARTLAHVPGFPGHGLGEILYSTYVRSSGSIPMLLSCGSMRTAMFILSCVEDCLYIPMDIGQKGLSGRFLKVPLVWTGVHYLLPIDNFEDDQCDIVHFNEGEGWNPVQVDFEHKRVVSTRDWEKLEGALSKALNRNITINRTGSQIAKGRESASSSDAADLSSSTTSSAWPAATESSLDEEAFEEIVGK